MEVVRLGQGVDATGRLAPEAIERTRTVLVEYAAQARDLGATAVRMVATSATRDAANRADFEDMVVDVLGQRPDVVAGTEEAELSFIGATASLDAAAAAHGAAPPRPPFLVVDIGGGSTEFVLGDAARRARRPLGRHRLRPAHRAAPARRPAVGRAGPPGRGRHPRRRWPRSSPRCPSPRPRAWSAWPGR